METLQLRGIAGFDRAYLHDRPVGQQGVDRAHGFDLASLEGLPVRPAGSGRTSLSRDRLGQDTDLVVVKARSNGEEHGHDNHD